MIRESDENLAAILRINVFRKLDFILDRLEKGIYYFHQYLVVLYSYFANF